MSHRAAGAPSVGARSRVLAAAALLVTAALPAHAQAASRDWRVCFTSGVQSCTQVLLTTAPQFVGEMRSGTFVDLLLRHTTQGGVSSALMDVSFYFAPTSAAGRADLQALTPTARFGAPLAPTADVWQAAATSGTGAPLNASTDVLLVRDTSTAYRDAPDRTPVQWIGGCDGPLADAHHASPLLTCGSGAYGFSFATAAEFDVTQVEGLVLDVYGADLLGPDAPGVAYCAAPVTSSAAVGVGFDGVDPDDATPCVVSETFASTVPEPATCALLGAGLLGVAAAAHRRTAP